MFCAQAVIIYISQPFHFSIPHENGNLIEEKKYSICSFHCVNPIKLRISFLFLINE